MKKKPRKFGREQQSPRSQRDQFRCNNNYNYYNYNHFFFFLFLKKSISIYNINLKGKVNDYVVMTNEVI